MTHVRLFRATIVSAYAHFHGNLLQWPGTLIPEQHTVVNYSTDVSHTSVERDTRLPNPKSAEFWKFSTSSNGSLESCWRVKNRQESVKYVIYRCASTSYELLRLVNTFTVIFSAGLMQAPLSRKWQWVTNQRDAAGMASVVKSRDPTNHRNRRWPRIGHEFEGEK